MTVKKPAASTPLWGEKPYRSLDYEWKKQYGEKIYKVSLNSDMTCPNRDGTVGSGGCIFCSAGGSGDFAADARLSHQRTDQIPKKSSRNEASQRSILWLTSRLIPTLMLRWTISGKFSPRHTPGYRGRRPDCLPDDVLDLLSSLNEIKPVTMAGASDHHKGGFYPQRLRPSLF